MNEMDHYFLDELEKFVKKFNYETGKTNIYENAKTGKVTIRLSFHKKLEKKKND